MKHRSSIQRSGIGGRTSIARASSSEICHKSNCCRRLLLEKAGLFYLWGHLTAFNNALILLLGFGPRIHPELDLMFVSNPDRTVPTICSVEDLKIIWQETSQILWTGFSKLSVADWLQKHGAVSEEDFSREPHRNRFTVLLGRTAHIAYHLGQAMLWQRVQTSNIN